MQALNCFIAGEELEALNDRNCSAIGIHSNGVHISNYSTIKKGNLLQLMVILYTGKRKARN
jgi:hypothetical protein